MLLDFLGKVCIVEGMETNESQLPQVNMTPEFTAWLREIDAELRVRVADHLDEYYYQLCEGMSPSDAAIHCQDCS